MSNLKNKLFHRCYNLVSEYILGLLLYNKYSLTSKEIDLNFSRSFKTVEEYLEWASKKIVVHIDSNTKKLQSLVHDITDIYEAVGKLREEPLFTYDLGIFFRKIFPLNMYIFDSQYLDENYFDILESALENTLILPNKSREYQSDEEVDLKSMETNDSNNIEKILAHPRVFKNPGEPKVKQISEESGDIVQINGSKELEELEESGDIVQINGAKELEEVEKSGDIVQINGAKELEEVEKSGDIVQINGAKELEESGDIVQINGAKELEEVEKSGDIVQINGAKELEESGDIVQINGAKELEELEELQKLEESGDVVQINGSKELEESGDIVQINGLKELEELEESGDVVQINGSKELEESGDDSLIFKPQYVSSADIRQISDPIGDVEPEIVAQDNEDNEEPEKSNGVQTTKDDRKKTRKRMSISENPKFKDLLSLDEPEQILSEIKKGKYNCRDISTYLLHKFNVRKLSSILAKAEIMEKAREVLSEKIKPS